MLVYFTQMIAGEELAQQLLSKSIEHAIANRSTYDPVFYNKNQIAIKRMCKL